MNRKQKVLTVIALIAFVVIGVCHYLGSPPVIFYKWIKRKATPEESARHRAAYAKEYGEESANQAQELFGTFNTVAQKQWHPEIHWVDPTRWPPKIAPEDRHRALSIEEAENWPKPPLVRDVRIPWFMQGLWAVSPDNSDEILSLAFEKDFGLCVNLSSDPTRN
jgi:hypothetical protein